MIPLNDQLGIEWDGDQGQRYRTVIGGSITPERRNVDAHVRSYVGTVAAGAMHWYAKVCAQRPQVIDLNEEEKWLHGGYLGKTAPHLKWREFDATRKVTKVEKDMSDEVVAKVGDETYRFNDERSAFFAMIKVLKDNFGAGWIANLELTEGGCYDIPVTETEATEEFYQQVKKACDQ